MAQGSKLTAEQIEAVADALAKAPSWRAAADAAGVNQATLFRYRQRADTYANRHESDVDLQNLHGDDDPDRPYWEAAQTWLAARSRGEMEMVDFWRAGAEKDWRAAQALLKSAFPDDYSDRVELTGAGGGPIQVDADALWQRAEEVRAQIEAKRVADSGERADASPAGNDE